jgi:hypothetical protein
MKYCKSPELDYKLILIWERDYETDSIDHPPSPASIC